ncbi:MAG: hypothetical protein WCF26_01265 [Candidatus Sulfotelmatobacter sp.]
MGEGEDGQAEENDVSSSPKEDRGGAESTLGEGEEGVKEAGAVMQPPWFRIAQSTRYFPRLICFTSARSVSAHSHAPLLFMLRQWSEG